MNKTYSLPEDDLRGEVYQRIYLLVSEHRGGWQSFAAAFGLAGGVLSILSALLLWATVDYLAPAGIGAALNQLSNFLFALCLPLLALGACCLDLLEKMPPALPLPARSRPASRKRLRRFRARAPHYN